MAITTLTELNTAVAERYARSDLTATVLGELVALAEAAMQRQMRAIDMETKTESFSLDGEYVPVPTDFLGVRDFYVTSANTRSALEFAAPEYISRHYGTSTTSSSDTPPVYTIVGRNFRLGGTSSGDNATLVYYAKIPPLTSTNVTNWVLRDHPDAYLYGCLTQAAIKYQDPQAATGYGTLFSNALDGIQGLTRARWASGPSMYSRLG